MFTKRPGTIYRWISVYNENVNAMDIANFSTGKKSSP